ncbi:glycosyltransferase family protein [Thiohalorhabdus sp.]|uniref:glycosyltransferase family protein n=1 Tax=Thiohalorhabdus sp. TaxID=3094134 RepID=UPI002FC288CF
MPRPRVLFAVHNWGLGHATRSLALIRGLVERGHEVTVLSSGKALRFLADELGEACELLELGDIPQPVSRNGAIFYVRLTLSMPLIFWIFRRDRRWARRLCREKGIDLIVSDTRFGVLLPEVPSYFITQSLRQIIPGRPYLLEMLVEAAQRRMLAHARKVFIPDSAGPENLTGDLSHNLLCDWGDRPAYLGPLTAVVPESKEEDLDCFISISGPEPQRTILAERVLDQVEEVPGQVLVTLGKPDAACRSLAGGRIQIYGFLEREEQAKVMQRTRLVVCRPGLSTLSEIAVLGKQALFIPTPGQSEQGYLAHYHWERGEAYMVDQQKLDLPRDKAVAETYPGLTAPSSNRHPVRGFLDHLSN